MQPFSEQADPADPLYNLLNNGRNWMDLSRLDKGGLEISREFPDQLLFQRQAIRIETATEAIRGLRHLYFENKNREKLGGFGNLHLGFPVLSFQNALGEQQLAPVFLVRAELEADGHRPDTWVLRLPASEIRLNPVFSENQEEALLTPDEGALRKSLEKLAKSGDWELPEEIFPIDPLRLEEEPKLQNRPTVLQAAIIGLFSVSGHSSGLVPPKTEDSRPALTYGLPALLPLEQQLFEAFLLEERPRVHSHFPGRMSLLARKVLTNQLANDGSVLVISDRASRLDELKAGLASIGLDGLCAVIRNEDYDRHLLAQLLLAELAEQRLSRTEDFQVLINQYDRLYRKLSREYRSVRLPKLFDWNWTELVGRFLNSQEIEGRELLERQLKVSTFRWTTAEFESIQSQLSKSARLYRKIGTLRHPLTAIHPMVFLEKDREEARAICTAGLQTWKERMEELHFKLLGQINEYALQLTELFERHYLELRQGLDRVLNRLEDFRLRYGPGIFDRTAPGPFSALISSRKKDIRRQYEDILAASSRLEQQRRQLAVIDFSPESSSRRPAAIQDQLESFRDQLEAWRLRIPELVEEEVQRLGSKKVHPSLDRSFDAGAVEQEMDHLLATLKDTGWLAESPEHNVLTLPQRQKHLEKISEVLDNVELNLRDFDDFYNWHRHWLRLPENGQAVVRALIKVKAENWEAAFESWYFHQLLRRQPLETLPDGERDLLELLDCHRKLRKLLPDAIKQKWVGRFRKSIRTERASNRKLTRRMGILKPEEMPKLEDLFRLFPESMRQRFPIICTTPDQALRLFQNVEWSFDALIVWESNAVADQVISNLESVIPKSIVFSEHNCREGIALDRQQLGRHSPWTTLPISDYQWSVREIMGIYDPQLRVNEGEAMAAIRLLNEVQQTRQRTFPRTGIVTMGVEQRNQIATYLQEIKQKPGAATDKILHLERNGMMVVTLEESAGLEFDQIILCLERDLWPDTIDKSMAAAIRRVLRQRKLILLHSVSEIPEFTGGGIGPAQLIPLAQAIEHGSLEEARALIRLFQTNKGEEAIPNTFVQRLDAKIKEHFPGWSTAMGAQIEDRIIPFSVNHAEHTWHILPDLFRSELPFTSFEWEASQWLTDKEDGNKPKAVWSIDWWRNPVRADEQFYRQFREDIQLPSADISLEEE